MAATRNDRFMPRRSGYLVGVLLIVLALFGVPAFTIWIVFSQPSPVTFRTPGPLEFFAKQTGKHTLWHEYDTIFDA